LLPAVVVSQFSSIILNGLPLSVLPAEQ